MLKMHEARLPFSPASFFFWTAYILPALWLRFNEKTWVSMSSCANIVHFIFLGYGYSKHLHCSSVVIIWLHDKNREG
nr:MAG TPA: hypothetical protein [Caudoviricetes sp.]